MEQGLPITLVIAQPGPGRAEWLEGCLGYVSAGKVIPGPGSTGNVPECLPATSDPNRVVVLTQSDDPAHYVHSRVMRVRETVQLNDAGCACCRAKGPFVDTLRDLFMALLQRREPKAERLVILVPGVDDAVALRRMLQLDTFLADRYRLDGCVALLEDGLDPQQQVAGLSTESGCIVSGRGFGVPAGRTAHLVLH